MALLSYVSRSPSRSRMFTASTGVRFRFGPRRDDSPEGQVIPIGGGLLDTRSVVEVVEHLRDHGYDTILTSALTPDEQRPFLDAGFRTQEHLRLLFADAQPDDGADRHRGVPHTTRSARRTRRTRRMRRRNLARVLDIDAATFSPFWRFDRTALQEAMTATPSCRSRVVSVGGPAHRHVVGYAVTGRSGDQGFVQRLAVDPAHQGSGIGRALLDDALDWLTRQGATTVLVNTQSDNDVALDLYRSAGFTDRPGGLTVLRLEAKPS